MWVAVVSALVMPTVCAFYVIPIKYVNDKLKINAVDFSAGYWFLASLAL